MVEEATITEKKAEEIPSSETTETLAEGSMTQEKPLTESFVYMDNVKSILDVAMSTKKNAILYGPGGYGKSEYSLAYFEEKGIDPYIITMGSGMTTDRLFGGLNIPTFNSTGKIEYLVENSFMNSEFAIFEELFDAPDFILEQLKDILSSGVFRNGTQIFPIRTKVIICCTNKTREEFSKNNSLKALMERFPLETQVVWKDHNRITYEHLLKTKMGFSDPFLPYLLEQYAVNGIKISPRIAVISQDIVATCGPDALMHIAEFNKKPDLFKTSVSKFQSLSEVNTLAQEMQDIATILKSTPLDTLDRIKVVKSNLSQLNMKLIKLKAIKADDSIVANVASITKTYTDLYATINKAITITLAMEDTENVDATGEALNF